MSTSASRDRLPAVLIAAGALGFIVTLGASPAFRQVFEAESAAAQRAAIDAAPTAWIVTWVALGVAVLVVAGAVLRLARANGAGAHGSDARLWRIAGIAVASGSLLYVGMMVGMASDGERFVTTPGWVDLLFLGFNLGMVIGLACAGLASWREGRRGLASWLLLGAVIHFGLVVTGTEILPLTYYVFFFVAAIVLIVKGPAESARTGAVTSTS